MLELMRSWAALLGLASLACSAPDEATFAGVTTTAGSGGGATAAAASSTTAASGGSAGARPRDGDGDGFEDTVEDAMARDYFPFLSIHPDDDCPLHGVLYRLSPHPADPSKVHILYDVLYERDCGLNGHVGDNEALGVLVDPQLAAPDGILAVRSISHQGTLCEKTGTCGTLSGCSPCATALRNNLMYPVVFSSRDKHGGFVQEGTCDASVVCDSGGCAQNGTPPEPPFVNAGEPDAPLVDNLTTQGFIHRANGWSETSLFDVDPWADGDFGGAGNIASDLQDPSFVIDPNGC